MPTQWKSYERQPIISTLDGNTLTYLMNRLRSEWYENVENLDHGRETKARIIEKTMDNLMNVQSGLPPFHYQTEPNVLMAYLLDLERLEDPLIQMAIMDTFGKESLQNKFHLLSAYQKMNIKYFSQVLRRGLKRPRSHEKNA